MNIVEQIKDAMELRIVAVLPSTFSELKYKLKVEDNHFEENSKKFGVRPLEANSVPGVTQSITLDQEFEIILTDNYINLDISDEEQRIKTFNLYDRLDTIYTDLINTKAGIPLIVLNIPSLTISQPEYLEDDNVVALRAQILIKYRRSLT